MDGSLYLILTAVPLQAIGLKASPFILGLLPALSAGVYIISAATFGRLSDRSSRMGMARWGALVRAVAAFGLTQAHSVGALLAWMPVLGIANGLFWPGLQAAIGEFWPERDLRKNLGAFNVSWSTGKMLGFLGGGVLIGAAGTNAALLVAGAATGLVAWALPSLGTARSRGRSSGEAAVSAPDPPGAAAALSPGARRWWRIIGWTANFVLFGVGATLNFQYPKLLVSLGYTGRDFGTYLGAVYLFQTLSFVWLRGWSGWLYRLAPLLLAQGLTLAAVGVLGWLRSWPLILATAPLVGLGLGLCYSSSIYYSLYRESGRGRNTGIHEALLGTGTFVLPLLGGVAAQVGRSLLAPYLLCALALVGSMIAEARMARRAASSPM